MNLFFDDLNRRLFGDGNEQSGMNHDDLSYGAPDAPTSAELAEQANTQKCEHAWKVTSQRLQGMWCRCEKCGATKEETWD